MNAKVKFVGFCVIITESRSSFDGKITNVGFSKLEKELIKKGIGYTSDVEREKSSDTFTISRKIVFPLLTPEQMLKLVSDRCLYYESETMGSLTIEHGFINAKSYCADFDYYRNENSNAYISVLFDFEGFQNVEKGSHCMQKNYKFQENLENEIFEALDQDNLEYFENVPEFNYNLDQLEIQFQNL